MNTFQLMCFTVITVFMVSCKSTQAIEDPIPRGAVYFEKDAALSAVLDKAKAENKLVFLDIYTDWCLPCQLMDEEVFTDQGMADYMNDHFINYKVDAEKGEGPDLKYLYQVEVYPTLLFLDAKGKVIIRNDGAAFHTQLRNLGDQAMMEGLVGQLD